MTYKLNIPGILILIPINVIKDNQLPSPAASFDGQVVAASSDSVANYPPIGVPSNSIADDSKSSYAQASISSPKDNIKTGLKSLNKGLDTLFHDSIEDIKEQTNAYFPQSRSITVTDANGKKIKIQVPKTGAGFTYYEPGSYKYSADSYVPDYEDSVLLSPSIGLVPRLEGEFFIPANPKKLNSIETDYTSSDTLITSSTILANNTNYAATNDRESKLMMKYSIEKTDEELEYENRVADLLEIQNGIRNYATRAPMNVQTKIPKPQNYKATPTKTTTKSKPTLGPSILQKNKNDIFKIGAGAPISTDYLLMTSDQ